MVYSSATLFQVGTRSLAFMGNLKDVLSDVNVT